MPRPLPPAYQAIADIESRQDEVLAQLEELEQRVEQALRTFGAVIKPSENGLATVEFPQAGEQLRAAG
jgi:hypothetical protein